MKTHYFETQHKLFKWANVMGHQNPEAMIYKVEDFLVDIEEVSDRCCSEKQIENEIQRPKM